MGTDYTFFKTVPEDDVVGGSVEGDGWVIFGVVDCLVVVGSVVVGCFVVLARVVVGGNVVEGASQSLSDMSSTAMSPLKSTPRVPSNLIWE